jgi:hypothetical protein
MKKYFYPFPVAGAVPIQRREKQVRYSDIKLSG